MSNVNQFFRKLSSNPSLLWKSGAGLLFVGLGLAIAFVPSFIEGLEANRRYLFGGILILYGLFRLGTFYNEYKRVENE